MTITTCSKLFSGDLPELANEIIQYFRNDFSTLHSCILVNRLWCRLAIPLLWEDPFSVKFPKNYRFIEIYLNNLNEDDKRKLNKYGINYKIFPNTLFDYPSFIKCLDTLTITFFIKEWIKTIATREQLVNYIEFKNFTKLICSSLFQIFIENEANLHTFVVEITSNSENDYFEDLFLQNPNFISNIKNLILRLRLNEIHPFVKFLYSNCNSISSLYLRFSNTDCNNIGSYLSQITKIINSQQNLEKISFYTNDKTFPLNNTLLSLKNSNCSNTLKTTIFYGIDFKNVFNFREAFEQLNVLESTHFLYCSLNSDLIQEIININKPFKLKSLFIDEMLQVESLQLLLQKSGDYLENFGFGIYEPKLLELTIKYCTNIKSFDVFGLYDNQISYLALELIKNIRQSLNYLSINLNYSQSLSSIILLNLGQILPIKLECLRLDAMTVVANDFEVFLKGFQNTFIKKLLVSYRMQGGSEDILPYIKKYVAKEKRIEYLAICEKGKNLFFLKDEVKELKQYNIKVEIFENFRDSYEFMNNYMY